MNEQIKEFASFLFDQFRTPPSTPYTWPFNIRFSPGALTWLPDTWRQGTTFGESSRVLDAAGDAFQQALEAENDNGLRDAIAVIMDWGGVWNAGPRRNQPRVEQALREGTLRTDFLADRNAMEAGQFGNIRKMNAGWSKIHAVTAPVDTYVMYDSRVACALGNLVLAWASEDAARGVLKRVLRQTMRRRDPPVHRFIPEYPSINYRPARWAESMAAASMVIRMVREIADEGTSSGATWLTGRSAREIEGSL